MQTTTPVGTYGFDARKTKDVHEVSVDTTDPEGMPWRLKYQVDRNVPNIFVVVERFTNYRDFIIDLDRQLMKELIESLVYGTDRRYYFALTLLMHARMNYSVDGFVKFPSTISMATYLAWEGQIKSAVASDAAELFFKR